MTGYGKLIYHRSTMAVRKVSQGEKYDKLEENLLRVCPAYLCDYYIQPMDIFKTASLCKRQLAILIT